MKIFTRSIKLNETLNKKINEVSIISANIHKNNTCCFKRNKTISIFIIVLSIFVIFNAYINAYACGIRYDKVEEKTFVNYLNKIDKFKYVAESENDKFDKYSIKGLVDPSNTSFYEFLINRNSKRQSLRDVKNNQNLTIVNDIKNKIELGKDVYLEVNSTFNYKNELNNKIENENITYKVLMTRLPNTSYMITDIISDDHKESIINPKEKDMRSNISLFISKYERLNNISKFYDCAYKEAIFAAYN